METLGRILDFMRPHWNTVALVATWLGIFIVALRRRRQWRRKQFLGQVNFSLNYTAGKQLAMRTLLETSAARVWPNEHGVRKVLAAAARTTVANPFIIMKTGKDRDYVNRAVLNALSERFAETFVAAALGAPYRAGTFVFAVTREKYEDIRTHKLRVILMEERALVELFGPEGRAGELEVNNAVYKARLATLRGLYELYAKDQSAERPVLGRVELGVVATGTAEGALPAPACTSAAPVA
jgi:hypothetical protein